MGDSDRLWEELGSRDRPSWYLDPLVAQQKGEAHRRLILRWLDGFKPRRVLKTDAFEEANGQDQILFDLFPSGSNVYGMDVAWATASSAGRRCPSKHVRFLAGDVRRLPFPDNSFDLILSTSTLDHFDRADELRQSVAELQRVLSPGGRIIITLDNAANPFYGLLRWATRRRGSPFFLGQSLDHAGLCRLIESLGMRLISTDFLIHNPRLLSTLLFLAIRKTLGRYADTPVRALLACFALLDRLPTRSTTGCFVAAFAEKPVSAARRANPSASKPKTMDETVVATR